MTTHHPSETIGAKGLPGYASRESCESAHRRIAPHIVHTPLEPSPELSRRLHATVLLKLENHQTTDSFKLRGVLNRVFSLSEQERKKPLVAASSGNHGAAFAHALTEFDLRGRLFTSRAISKAKLEWLQHIGVDLEIVGDDTVEAELAARACAQEQGCVLIPPYNHPDIVVGQSTVGVELLQDAPDLDAVLVPVGGGGLISGIGAYLKAASPNTAVIACQPVRSPIMLHSIQAGQVVEEESLPTLADGTAGGIEPETITFDFCQRVVDEFVLLSEEEIGAAMVFMRRYHGMDIEGAAALSVAGAWKLHARFQGKRIALIISGARVKPSVIDELERTHG